MHMAIYVSIWEQIRVPIWMIGTTDHPDRYSNLFLNAYINRQAHTEYLK